MGLTQMGWKLNEDEVTLPEYLGEAGYRTGVFGVQHVDADDERLGYDIIETDVKQAPDVADRFIEFLESSDQDEPIFTSVGFFEPHRPFDLPRYETDDPDETEPLPFLPDREGIRRDLADMRGHMRTVDTAVGDIVRALEDEGLESETLFVFTTDHGVAFPRAKGTCYDAGIEVALLVRYPGTIEGGVNHEELVSNVDVLPTILDAGGVEVPPRVQGRSFLPALLDNEYQEREAVFAGMTWHGDYVPMRAVRTEQFKYVRNFWQLPLVYLPTDIFASLSGREMREEYYVTKRPAEQLYDLERDPHEQENLVDDPDYSEQLESLRARVEDWMVEIDDPLLEGPIEPPEILGYTLYHANEWIDIDEHVRNLEEWSE